MAKIRVFIVDDEHTAIETLAKLFDSFFEDVEVVGKASNVEDAYKLITESKPDLVFLDIEMGRQSGFDLLELFDSIFFKVVFLTAHEEYALRAIKLSAIDYIIKPASIGELKSLFTKLNNDLDKKSNNQQVQQMFGNFLSQDKYEHKIALPIADGVEFVRVNDILYIRADGSYTHFHLRDTSTLTVSKNLKFFESILIEYGFYRIHNSTLVNLRYIDRIGKSAGGYVVMENKVELSISKSRKEDFLKLLSV